jgi:hypothetical protein
MSVHDDKTCTIKIQKTINPYVRIRCSFSLPTCLQIGVYFFDFLLVYFQLCNTLLMI